MEHIIRQLDLWDKQLMLWLNYDGGAFQDTLWYFLSGKFTWIPLYGLLWWLLWRGCQTRTTTVADSDRRHRPIDWLHLSLLIVVTALVVVVADQIASGLIKNWVMRPRPSQPDSGIASMIHLVNGYRGGHYGFVSSHAANTWGIALWFMLLFKRNSPLANRARISLRRLPWLLTLFAALNCYSRIYLGVHYPGDIIGGLLVGTFAAFFCYYLVYPYGKRWLKIED